MAGSAWSLRWVTTINQVNYNPIPRERVIDATDLAFVPWHARLAGY
jgi:hypothetical protein